MVHSFGILGPDRFERQSGAEAPGKANFFGGLPDIAGGAVPMSRAEQDASYLAGKAPEPEIEPAPDASEREARDK